MSVKEKSENITAAPPQQETDLQVVHAEPKHIPIIHEMIDGLADHLDLSHELVATEEDLLLALFGPRPQAEVILAYIDDKEVGFALFYNNYSTFRGRGGIHLEDLYIKPEWRGRGIGKKLLAYLSKLTIERGCNRLEWWVLGTDEKTLAFYDSLDATHKDEWFIYRLRGQPLTRLAAQTE